jgi:hypothetical protein
MSKPKYRSGLEEAFGVKHKDFQFEPFDVPYIIKRKYKPDFVKDDVLIECKGFFRAGDTAKYKAIKACTEGQYELVFVLSDPNKKVRKGSKMNMGQWCDKEGIKHFTVDQSSELNKYMKER